jgi:MFS family permease
LFNLKAVFLASIFWFEVGSLIIAAAQNSMTVVVGRAVQGAGGTGVTVGCYAYIVRPKWLLTVMVPFGIMWSCASVISPLVGVLGKFQQVLHSLFLTLDVNTTHLNRPPPFQTDR